MSTIIFDPVAFREQFPAFQCTPAIANKTLQGYWDTATLYINDNTTSVYCGGMRTAQRTQCLYLMTAHIAAINRFIATGQTAGVITNGTVDKVSVTIEPPPSKNQWQYWLQTTPYGQQLLALLQVIGVGGLYVGGRPELSAFRRPSGYYH